MIIRWSYAITSMSRNAYLGTDSSGKNLILLLFLNRSALLIRRLPHVVPRRAVVARQIDISTTGGRATDVGRGLPDHLRVMTGRIPIRFSENRAAVPLCFFVDPELD